jgi:hypothetical protein
VKFVVNKPITLKVPTVVVDAGLPPGEHVFRLVVENEHGLQSKPAEAIVIVKPG